MNVTKRLVSDGVCAIIGPGQSGVAIAMTSVTEPANVPFLATSATNPKVTVDDKTGKPCATPPSAPASSTRSRAPWPPSSPPRT